MIGKFFKLSLLQPSTFRYFSTIKTSLQKYKQYPYTDIASLYQDLNKYEQLLDYPSSLKYAKYLEQFDKKIKKINKKQKMYNQDGNDQNQEISSSINKKDNWWRQSVIDFEQQLNTSKTYEYFYRLQTESCKPFQKQYSTRKLPIQYLYNLVTRNNDRNLNIFYSEIIKKPMTNSGIFNAIKERYQYLQHFFCMLCFEGYKQFYCRSLEYSTYEGKEALKRLYKKQAKYQSDFKFIPNQMTTQTLQKLLDIGNNLIRYNFASERVSLFSQKVFTDQQLYQKLTSRMIRKNLFILGYGQTPVLNIDSKLYEIFDSINEQTGENVGQEWWPYEILFYLLANKLEYYTLVQEIVEIKVSRAWFERLPKVDKQIMYLMNVLIEKNFGLQLKDLQGEKFTIKFQEVFQMGSQEDQIGKDFITFLNKRNYPYKLDLQHKITDDILINIDNKDYMCINSDKFLMNYTSTKFSPNGKGRLILQHFNLNNQPIKLINTTKILNMEKFTTKQQYFRTKMKGVKPLKIVREKKYTF